MKQPRTSQFKRGDTFLLTCTYKVEGEAEDLTGFAFRSQLRNRFGHLVAELDATIADQEESPGLFYLQPDDADTSAWEVGDLACDIEITQNDVIRSTITFTVPVVDDITK